MGIVHLVVQDGMRLFVVMKWDYHTVADYPIKYEQSGEVGEVEDWRGQKLTESQRHESWMRSEGLVGKVVAWS